MNTLLSHSLIAITAGLIGGFSNSFFFSEPQDSTPATNSEDIILNSLDTQTYSPENIQRQVQFLHQQVNVLNTKFAELAEQQTANLSVSNTQELTRSSISNRDNIINSGINSDTADEILYRIEQQNDRQSELHTLIQNSEASELREYGKELLEFNKNKISLRSEMGDDAYDQYLFLNRQNNRLKVTSVFSGSPAESAGIEPNDIILYYDNQKVLDLSDIRSAVSKGEIGSNTIVQIVRDGEEISLTLLSGTLGAQFEPVLVDPALSH